MNAERLSNGAFARSYYYDSLSRPISINTQIDGETYTVNSYYDANYGRPKGMRYPGGLTVQYGYSSTGYLTTTQNASSGYIYRKINSQDAFGNWLQADLAAGVLTQDRNYDEATGQLRAAMLSQITGVIHKQTYDSFDHFGNLTQMSTELAGSTYTESFSYDDMHRLLQNNRSNGPTINYSYDAVGNLLSKSDFANNYQYNGSKPNAVSQVSLISGSTKTYGYDNNGNRTKENGITTAYYNTYNHPTRLIKGSADLRFFYAPDLSRYKQTNGAKTTVYIDKLFEKITDTGKTQYRYFIDDIAVLTETETASDTQQEIVFTHRDRLGSTIAMADDLGMAVETHSFDPFGKPREGDLSDKLKAVLDSQYTTRGFTDHEHLDDVELIHMNGRVYDYNLGRFLSVDPVIQSPGNSQSMNPYSYIMNNPLSNTDPTGYCAGSDSLEGCADSLESGEVSDITNADGNVIGTVGKDSDGNLHLTRAMGENGHDAIQSSINNFEGGKNGSGQMADSIGGGQDRNNVRGNDGELTANNFGGVDSNSANDLLNDGPPELAAMSGTDDSEFMRGDGVQEGLKPTEAEYQLIAEDKLAEVWQARCAAGDPIGCVGFGTWGDPSDVIATLGRVEGAYWLAVGYSVRFNARNGLVAGNPELLFDPNALEAAALSFGKAIATAHLDATAADLSGRRYFLSAPEITSYHHAVFDQFNVSRRWYGGSYVTGRHEPLLEFTYCRPSCDGN